MNEAAHNAGENTEAKQITQISPVAWRHINLRGRFEFQKHAGITSIDQVISSLQQKISLQELTMNQEPVERDAYFTFLRG